MSAPVGIQRKRTKGWRMPENTVSVCRPGVLGNPFTKEAAIESGNATEETWRQVVVDCFDDWLQGKSSGRGWWWAGEDSDKRRKAILECLPALRGKHLACWCGLDQPCHRNVYLRLANAPTVSP